MRLMGESEGDGVGSIYGPHDESNILLQYFLIKYDCQLENKIIKKQTNFVFNPLYSCDWFAFY